MHRPTDARHIMDARWYVLTSAVERVLAQLDDDAQPFVVIVGVNAGDGSELHYLVRSGDPTVRVVQMFDGPDVDKARELMNRATVDLTAPDTTEGAE